MKNEEVAEGMNRMVDFGGQMKKNVEGLINQHVVKKDQAE